MSFFVGICREWMRCVLVLCLLLHVRLFVIPSIGLLLHFRHFRHFFRVIFRKIWNSVLSGRPLTYAVTYTHHETTTESGRISRDLDQNTGTLRILMMRQTHTGHQSINQSMVGWWSYSKTIICCWPYQSE